MVFKFADLVNIRIDYFLTKFQLCRLSGSSFTKGFEKHNDAIMSSFHNFGIRIRIFCQTDYKLSTCKFPISRLSGSNLKRLV